MHRTLYHTLIACLVTALLFACGGGDTYTTSGIGGTGSPVATVNVETTGTITGFGSIFVNGVEYETANAVVDLDGLQSTDGSLKLGMVVNLGAVVNDDGTTGSAEAISMEHDVQGPVADNILLDPDNLRKTFSVFDVTVVAERYSTVFHPSVNTSAFSFDQLKKNDVVSISGFFDDRGRLVATSIEEGALLKYGATKVILKGEVSDYDGSSFKLGGATIQLTGTTDLSELGAAGLAGGRIVKVYGILTGPVTIAAERIRPHPDETGTARLVGPSPAATQMGLPEAGLVSVEGIVTHLDSLRETFTLNGQLVDYHAVSAETLDFALSGGVRVEVLGAPTEGVLVAAAIRPRSGNIELAGLVWNVDPSASTIVLEMAPGQFVTLRTDLRTMIKDETGSEVLHEHEEYLERDLGLAAMANGDFLLVQARLGSTGITATAIKRNPLSPGVIYCVRGPVSRFDPATGEITVLGVTFYTGPGTSYQIDDTVLPDGSLFYTSLQPNDLVSVRDIRLTASTLLGDAIADEVEIER